MTYSTGLFNSFQHHPVGTRLGGSVHAISCSLPSMRHIIGYEEKNHFTMQHLCGGYPRFVRHTYLDQCLELLKIQHQIPDRAAYLLSSEKCLPIFHDFLKQQQIRIPVQSLSPDLPYLNETLCIHLDVNDPNCKYIDQFLQHTGLTISSRQAENCLLHLGQIKQAQFENRFIGSYAQAHLKIRQALQSKHDTSSDNIYLANCGMAAFLAAYLSLREIQNRRGRKLWIQLGWLYIDTVQLLIKFSNSTDNYQYFGDVNDLDSLREFIRTHANQIAGVVTETPTNPLMQTCDVKTLRTLCNEYDIALVLDPTTATPQNIKILPHADMVINSLTKFAASDGDIIMGSLALNPDSIFYAELKEILPDLLQDPALPDVLRMAYEIEDYDRVVDRMNHNTMRLASFLESHSAIKRVHWAYAAKYATNYDSIARNSNSPGCMISIELAISLNDFYDRIQIAKGPSFGLKFSLLCPFIYLAHYDMVSSTTGRARLNANQLSPELIRISVGTESYSDLEAIFADALKF